MVMRALLVGGLMGILLPVAGADVVAKDGAVLRSAARLEAAIACGDSVQGALTADDEDRFGDGTRADSYPITLAAAGDVTVRVSGGSNAFYLSIRPNGGGATIASDTGTPAEFTTSLGAGTYQIVVNNNAVESLPIAYTVTVTCTGQPATPTPTATPTATVSPTPTPVCTGDCDPNEVLSHLVPGNWEPILLPSFFEEPELVFVNNGLNFQVPHLQAGERGYFGIFQTPETMVVPAAGIYRATVTLQLGTDPGAGQDRPECRVRVFRPDGLFQRIGTAAESGDNLLATQIPVMFEAAAGERFQVAVDVVSFLPQYEGGFRVTNIAFEKVK